MKPPKELHPWIVALFEANARRSGIDPADAWAYAARKKAPPPELRDAIVATFFPLVPPDSFLPSHADNDTLDTLDATELTAARRGRPLHQRKHPFVVALLRDGLTIAEIAKDLKRAPSTVKSWYKAADDIGFRPIPRAAAKELLTRLAVPLSAWSRIAD